MIRRSGLARRLVGVGTKTATLLTAIEYATETRQVQDATVFWFKNVRSLPVLPHGGGDVVMEW